MGICAITYENTALCHVFKLNNDKYYISVYFKNMLLNTKYLTAVTKLMIDIIWKHW